MNINYFWQRKQDKIQGEPRDRWSEHLKSERKKLRKKLTVPIGGKPRTHDMDDEMYETVNKMLQSKDRADIEIAREIIFDSNISIKHLDKLVTEHTTLLLYGPYVGSLYDTGMTASFAFSNSGNVGIGTPAVVGSKLNVSNNNTI
jgi:hypothetical protein